MSGDCTLLADKSCLCIVRKLYGCLCGVLKNLKSTSKKVDRAQGYKVSKGCKGSKWSKGSMRVLRGLKCLKRV